MFFHKLKVYIVLSKYNRSIMFIYAYELGHFHLKNNFIREDKFNFWFNVVIIYRYVYIFIDYRRPKTIYIANKDILWATKH